MSTKPTQSTWITALADLLHGEYPENYRSAGDAAEELIGELDAELCSEDHAIAVAMVEAWFADSQPFV